MKKEYHRKISELENEIKSHENKKFESLNSNLIGGNEKIKIEESYKQKIMDMESKLKNFIKKDKAQDTLFKQLNLQQTKISDLDQEIKKTKKQKVEIIKAMKFNSER